MSGAGERAASVRSCDLRVTDEPWGWGAHHAAAIDAAWDETLKTHPHHFNGTIHLAITSELTRTDVLSARFIRTDFKSFLYWRHQGYPESGATDAFGSAILRSAEGHVLLGRQRAGHINGGDAYMPGGFIDSRDVRPDGAIDIAASIARELVEETHLDPTTLSAQPGFIIVRTAPAHLSIGREFRSQLPADRLRSLILDAIARDPDPELADIVVIRSLADTEGARVLPYAMRALEMLLGPR